MQLRHPWFQIWCFMSVAFSMFYNMAMTSFCRLYLFPGFLKLVWHLKVLLLVGADSCALFRYYNNTHTCISNYSLRVIILCYLLVCTVLCGFQVKILTGFYRGPVYFLLEFLWIIAWRRTCKFTLEIFQFIVCVVAICRLIVVTWLYLMFAGGDGKSRVCVWCCGFGSGTVWQWS